MLSFDCADTSDNPIPPPTYNPYKLPLDVEAGRTYSIFMMTNMKPGKSSNMYQVPADYIAERRNPNAGATYFVPVCTRSGQSWGRRCATRDEAVTLVLEANRRVIEAA
jgi:hypothetical protein